MSQAPSVFSLALRGPVGTTGPTGWYVQLCQLDALPGVSETRCQGTAGYSGRSERFLEQKADLSPKNLLHRRHPPSPRGYGGHARSPGSCHNANCRLGRVVPERLPVILQTVHVLLDPFNQSSTIRRWPAAVPVSMVRAPVAVVFSIVFIGLRRGSCG